MAFVKLYLVKQDGPLGYQTVNQFSDNQAEMRTQMFIEHGSVDLLGLVGGGAGKAGGPVPPRYDELGHHNIQEIPRTVARTSTFSQFAGFGTFGTGLDWRGPAIAACYWISTGVYFLPVMGLSTFWGKVTTLPDTSFTVLEPQVRSLYASASNGQVNGLEVRLFKLDAGDFIPDDQSFSIALYGVL